MCGNYTYMGRSGERPKGEVGPLSEARQCKKAARKHNGTYVSANALSSVIGEKTARRASTTLMIYQIRK